MRSRTQSTKSRGYADRHPMTVTNHPQNLRTIRSNKHRIATWNIRTLHQPGKIDGVIQEMDRLKINILGLCEVRWKHSGQFKKGEKTVIYSGGDEHRRGVALIIDKLFSKSILAVWPKSERVLLTKLKSSPANINIIVAYAPTSDSDENTIEYFYAELDEVYQQCKSDEITIVIGDFNAKVGCERYGKTVGPFGLGEINERGEKLIEWCEEKNLVVTNTWFKVHPRRRYTWISPGDRTRNQIDYILINNRYRSSISKVKTYPGADANSDHVPVVANIKLHLKVLKTPKRKSRFMLNVLKKEEVRGKFRQAVIQNLDKIDHATSPESHWDILRTNLLEAAEKHIPKEERRSKYSHWMTQDIKDLMRERRLAKNDQELYRQINKQVIQECSKAKEQWLEQRCQEVEKLKDDQNLKEMYKGIREITGKIPSGPATCIKSLTGEILFKPVDVAERWSEYLSQLFDGVKMDDEEINSLTEPSGPRITKDEVEWALGKMKDDKAAGPDEVVAEMLKALGETGVDLLHDLICKIYETGDIPQNMLNSIFIALPKKRNAMECENHRTISLMSHTLKLLLRIILERCRSKIRPEIAPYQYGFMPDRGTRNAIFILRMLSERSIQHQQSIFICFVDYKKAFDRVQHKQLLRLLKQIGLDQKDQRIIYNLYRLQKAAIKVPDGLTNWTEVNRGVRQGCVMSPDFFNLYNENILRRLEDVKEGVLVNGMVINNIRYADDTALIANSEEGLQKLVNIVTEASLEEGLEINCKKTFCMVVCKSQQTPKCNVKCNNAPIEQVDSFNYLGSLLTADGRCRSEIKRRIAIAKSSFNQMKSIFTDRKLSTRLKIRLLKCYIWSVLLYGCESWTLSAETTKNLEAAEMWFFRRMLRIPYTAHETNTSVLKKVGQNRQLLNIIRERQLKFTGHIIRKGELEELSLSGKIPGKKARGGQRLLFLNQLMTNTNIKTSKEIWEAARNRSCWNIMCRRGPYRARHN